MPRSDTSFDALRCKHCDAIVAELPRAAIVHRFKLTCLHCGLTLVVWPLERPRLDVTPKQEYTTLVPM
jgi:hypothetical protein